MGLTTAPLRASPKLPRLAGAVRPILGIFGGVCLGSDAARLLH